MVIFIVSLNSFGIPWKLLFSVKAFLFVSENCGKNPFPLKLFCQSTLSQQKKKEDSCSLQMKMNKIHLEKYCFISNISHCEASAFILRGRGGSTGVNGKKVKGRHGVAALKSQHYGG